jgi:hypothetical protein
MPSQYVQRISAISKRRYLPNGLHLKFLETQITEKPGQASHMIIQLFHCAGKMEHKQAFPSR